MRARGGVAGRVLRAAARWCVRHRRLSLWLLVCGVASRVTGFVLAEWATLSLLTALALGSGAWSTVWPVSYERVAAGPSRRMGWRRWVRSCWPGLARACGLSEECRGERTDRHGRTRTETTWTPPRLLGVATEGAVLAVTVRARVGQTVDDLERAGPAIRDAAGACSVRTVDVAPGTVRYQLVMHSVLQVARVATAVPREVLTAAVPVGRCEDGTAWVLRIAGLHTLVVGSSGAGKGSPLWGVTAGLAPASAAGLVRLWGMDLKRGMEVLMGAGVWSATATTPAEAVGMLRRLLGILQERGDRLAGSVRGHSPSRVDPLDVLVVDELATLTAYLTDTALRLEVTRLLGEILTQGRALGVVVVGFVQDPKKETIPFRDLFTQTVALRLRSREAVAMVLGDGLATIAPAHKISPDAQGTGYLIGEDARPVKVRADYWPDPLIRAVATIHRPAHRETLTMTVQAAEDSLGVSSGERGARPPRSPRAPRGTRSSGAAQAEADSDASASGGSGWVA